MIWILASLFLEHSVEWFSYLLLKTAWLYLYSSGKNTGMWRTDRQNHSGYYSRLHCGQCGLAVKIVVTDVHFWFIDFLKVGGDWLTSQQTNSSQKCKQLSVPRELKYTLIIVSHNIQSQHSAKVARTHRQILTRLSHPPDTKRLTGLCVWPTSELGCR